MSAESSIVLNSGLQCCCYFLHIFKEHYLVCCHPLSSFMCFWNNNLVPIGVLSSNSPRVNRCRSVTESEDPERGRKAREQNETKPLVTAMIKLKWSPGSARKNLKGTKLLCLGIGQCTVELHYGTVFLGNKF